MLNEKEIAISDINWDFKDRPDAKSKNAKMLWAPFCNIPTDKMVTRDYYAKGYPEGAVVHFTAGSDAKSSLSWGREEGYCFFMIAKNGTVYQSFPLNRWGHHCGISKHPDLGENLSKKLVGIEVDCAGKLTKVVSKAGAIQYKTWFGKSVPSENVEYCAGEDNVEEGYYEKFTRWQIGALTTLILWLKNNNPDVFNLNYVFGHDEISGPKFLGYRRKNDPGASLNCTMTIYRNFLINRYQAGDK